MSAANLQLAEMAVGNLSAKDRQSLLRKYQQAPEAPPERLLRRAEVAHRLSSSLRLVDLLAARGALTRIRLPGRRRGNGFLESQVAGLMAGGKVGNQ